MEQKEIFDKVVGILSPFVKSPEAFSKVNMETSILKDLKVNSARLVDIVLEIEDAFAIEVGDADADRVKTVGDAVQLILSNKK